MDYKKIIRNMFIILFTAIMLYGCSRKEKMNIDNTYYVEITNCPDSVKKPLMAAIAGKTSYYKNRKLQIMSMNYVTEDYPDMHYFNDIAAIGEPVKKGTRKIVIQFKGNYTVDSTFYSVKKFRFRNGSWAMTSDMGYFRVYPEDMNRNGADKFLQQELNEKIIQNVVMNTY
jgi:hypothetical protein